MRPPRGVEPLTPGPGQESVWAYPRPPRVEPTDANILIRLGGAVIARSMKAQRVLETSHPPVYYLPRVDIDDGALESIRHTTICEYKGTAHYFDVIGGDRRASAAAWTYPEPSPGYEALVDHVAFYPALMDSCEVDGEQARPQEGALYGGWVTSRVVGPFKGAPGTSIW